MSENDGVSGRTILYVSHLKKYFEISQTGFRVSGYVKALDDVSFSLREGETLGVVGETGCGKTTLGRTLLRLIDATGGNVYFNLPEDEMEEAISLERELDSLTAKYGEEKVKDVKEYRETLEKAREFRKKHSLTKLSNKELREYRKFMQPVFQDPFSSLNPRMLVKDIIAEPMKLLTHMTSDEIYNRSLELVNEIGLSEDHLYRFPHEFSGGQRQRIGIARAISIDPKLIVLDEPTSALDVSVQAQILNILKDIQKKENITYVFISHHLNVIRLMSDRVAVMYLGKLVELTDTERLFTNMLHPYTKALLSAIPVPDPKNKRSRIVLEGEIPSPANPPKGCYFHPRCGSAMRNCGWSPKDMSEPLKTLLEPFKEKESALLPSAKEIRLNEPEQIVEIEFETPLTDDKFNIFKDLIDKEAEKPGNIRYKAISSISLSETKESVIIKMIEPDTPTLKEVKPGHYVSCLLYDEEKKVTGENSEQTAYQDIEIG